MSKTQGYLEIRFDEGMLEKRNRLWSVLCSDFFQRFIRPDATVLDMGAGYCEFINNIRCGKKYALDVDESPTRYARKDVQVLVGESTEASALLKGEEVDVVFMSNFLEHIPTKDKLVLTLEEIRKILKPGGKLLMLQPNIRYCYKNYWDYFDHHIPLSDKSLEEVLKATHFTIRMIKPKFLPLTTKSRLPLNSWLVKLYLKIHLAQVILGKQMFICASKS
jgi:2-polyprenyl-3-methyl-5-hydroxy-6-metoxy-1,4-benzoquinol methylase